MKNSIFKSFRFEIIICSLLSLFYTILSELLIGILFIVVRVFVKEMPLNRDVLFIVQSPQLQDGVGFYNRMPKTSTAKYGILAVVISFALIIGIVLFITYFLLLTKKFAGYLEEIAGAIEKISSGQFDTRVSIRNEDEFTLIAAGLNKMADDIQRIREKEKKDENTRQDLITSVAHDLRTPLTSIIGYLDLVSRNKELERDAQQKYIEIAYEKSRRLEKLIEDLFAYAKYSQGTVNISLSSIDMVKFLEQMGDEFYPSFQEAGLNYEFTSNTETAVILADGDLLSRAFDNLIGNAVKYGKDGKSIQIKLQDQGDKLIVKVVNYGEIIPEKDIKYIFERFYRVESSRSSETGGSGLGLAIAKNIIIVHGGEIFVTSDFNGTVFEVRLNKEIKQEGENNE